MALPNMDDQDASQKDKDSNTWQFRLYIAGNSPNSVQAMDNLQQICDRIQTNNPIVEIVDVLNDPARTLEDNVYVTPTLIRLSPEPKCRIIGSLNDQKRVLLALGLMEQAGG